MFWCKRIFVLALLAVAFYGCKPDAKQLQARYDYFDLKGFIRKDSARLAAADPAVDKTASHNGASETHRVHITNWGNELSLFSGSDINRPAWRRSYEVTGSRDSVIYTAKEPDLKTRRLVILKSGDRVVRIHIVNHTKNPLFQADEDLVYIPDSAYAIVKKQHVLFLGNNTYVIKGKLVK